MANVTVANSNEQMSQIIFSLVLSTLVEGISFLIGAVALMGADLISLPLASISLFACLLQKHRLKFENYKPILQVRALPKVFL